MSNNVSKLRERLGQIHAEAAAINDKPELSGQDVAAISALSAEFDSVSARIQAAELGERASAPQPTKTAPPAYGQASYTALPSRGITSTTGIRSGPTAGTAGFNSPGEWLGAIRAASAGQVDGRLYNTVTTFGGESGPGGESGGFSVPPDWRKEILELVAGPGTLIDAMTPIYTSSNQVVLPVDEASAHNTSSGILANWTAEAESITVSKFALAQRTIPLFKAAGLVHLSDELVEDNAATAGYALRILAKKVGALVEKAIVAGTGLAQPLGFLNAPGLVTQAKSATGATVIAAADPCNMVSRMIPGSFANSFWVMHSSVLPKIWTLTLGQAPIIAPDFTKSPYGTLLGRPIYVSEFCSDYNTAGDIFLVSPDGYGLALKSGGMRSDTSLHVGFDQHLQSFRCTMRVGGTPLLSAAVARANGSNTMSHLICLAARS